MWSYRTYGKQNDQNKIKITDAQYLFYRGARTNCLNEILNMCEKITIAEAMFKNFTDENVATIDFSKLDTSETKTMLEMFYGCSNLVSLDLSNFNTSNVQTMESMFEFCSGLETLNINNFNTQKVKSTSGMFARCGKLKTVDVTSFDTSNVTNVSEMFYECSAITDLDLSSFDLSKVTNNNKLLERCYELTNLTSFRNLGKGYTSKTTDYSNYSLKLSDCTKLTHDSLVSVMNNLYDLNLTYNVANGGTLYRQSLVLGSTNLAKLTAEEIAVATNKGWNVT